MKRSFIILLSALLMLLPSCAVHVPDEKLPEPSKTKEEIKLEYLRDLIENSTPEAVLDLSDTRSNLSVDFANVVAAEYGKLPKELQAQDYENNDYHPAIYDEKDIFPDSKGKYIYVMHYMHSSHPDCFDSLSEAMFEDGVLTICIGTTPTNACLGYKSLLLIVKIKKESFGGQSIDRILISHNVQETQQG